MAHFFVVVVGYDVLASALLDSDTNLDFGIFLESHEEQKPIKN